MAASNEESSKNSPSDLVLRVGLEFRALSQATDGFCENQFARFLGRGDEGVNPVPRVVGDVIERISRNLQYVAGSFFIVHPAGKSLDEFRTGIGDLPFALLEHLVHQLPATHSVI